MQLVVVEDYVDLSSLLESEGVDFASLSPYAYVRAKRRTPGLQLLAEPVNQGGASYEGYIVARANSNIVGLEDLKGKAFCYVGPNSTSGYLYPRALFRRRGLDPDAFFKATRFAGDHLAALRAVYSGACDGAAIYANVLFNLRGSGMAPDGFRILATTDRIPADAYCARDNLPADITLKFQRALLALAPGSKAGRNVLGAEALFLGFQKALDSDYEPVRKIERYLDPMEGRSQ
jgi:phosphate/phosphite/phosphonate ABC transporter binding protein